MTGLQNPAAKIAAPVVGEVSHQLDRVWYHNTLRTWIVAGVMFAVALLLLVAIRRLIVNRLGARAAKTNTQIDDLIVDIVRRTRWYFLVFLAFEIGTRALVLPARVDAIISKATVVVALLQIGIWASGIVTFWITRFYERRRAENDTSGATTIKALGVAARVFVWALVFAMLLKAFGFDVTALVTGLGIGGVAIALAVQNILGDLFAALAIVVDKPFVIGDFIVVDSVAGSVENIGLKTTRLRSISGEQIIASNSDLLKSRIRNYKRMYERRVVFSINVTYDTPPDTMARIPGIIREIITAQHPVRFDRSHFASYADSWLSFESVYYVLDPDYTRYMDIQQAIYLDILRRFNAEGIEFAFPTRTVVMGSDVGVRTNAAPAPAGSGTGA